LKYAVLMTIFPLKEKAVLAVTSTPFTQMVATVAVSEAQ
jgi:hypothetical protein